MSTIYFIRHGVSEANAGFATSDPKSINLTEEGITQANNLAEKRDKEPTYIIHSKYDRTLQTALPLIEKFSRSKVLCHDLIHEFSYLDPKACINTTADERLEMKQRFWNAEDIDFKDSPDTESVKDLILRTLKIIDDVREYAKGPGSDTIVFFSHGNLMNILIDILSKPNYNIEDENKQRIYKLLNDKNKKISNAQIVCINEYLL